MFENCKDVIVSGGGFPTSKYPDGVTLPLLQYPVNILYGDNGSGKSTIGKAFSQRYDDESEYYIDFNPDISQEEYDNIYVFNEDFINDNILEYEGGLRPILMIGQKNVAIASKLTEINSQIEKKDKEIESLQMEIDRLENSQYATSYTAKFEKLRDALRYKNGYAERGTMIRNRLTVFSGNKAAVVETTIDTIVKYAISVEGKKLYEENQSRDSLKNLIFRNLTILSSVKSGTGPVPVLDIPDDFLSEINHIIGLLGVELHRPELTESEKKLFALLDDSGRVGYLKMTRSDIIEKHSSTCPLCHQNISEAHFEKLSETVSRLLGEETDKHNARLRTADGYVSEYIDVVRRVLELMTIYPDGLFAGNKVSFETVLQKLQNFLNDLHEKLSEKQKNPYVALYFSTENVESLMDDAISVIGRLSDLVDDFNKMMANDRQLVKQTELANYCLAYYFEVSDKISDYKLTRGECEKRKTAMKQLQAQHKQLDSQLENLSGAMTESGIAMEYINTQLKNIFCTENRLQLVATAEGGYQLKSRGKIVNPQKVSTGEKNIIALVHFFATLFEGSSNEDKYKKNILVVVDDPISSFDHGNRLGLTSYLAMETRKILDGSQRNNMFHSKLLVMTHDIQTAFNLGNSLHEYNVKFLNNEDAKEVPTFLHLANGELYPQKRYDNEYSRLLKEIYFYAIGRNSDDMGIGNKIRQVMETYSTFMFKCGFKQMLELDCVKICIPHEEMDTFQYYFGRFILDSMSHGQNQYDTLDFVHPLFSVEEKRCTARLLLKFLMRTNSIHLEAYLKPEWMDNIQNWDWEKLVAG